MSARLNRNRPLTVADLTNAVRRAIVGDFSEKGPAEVIVEHIHLLRVSSSDGTSSACHIAGSTTGPVIHGLMVTLEWCKWTSDGPKYASLVQATCRSVAPLTVGICVRHRIAAREIVVARIGTTLGWSFAAPVEYEMASSFLLDEIVEAVRDSVKPKSADWEPPLRLRIEAILAPDEFKDGDLITAARLNLILNNISELRKEVSKLREQIAERGAAKPPHPPTAGVK